MKKYLKPTVNHFLISLLFITVLAGIVAGCGISGQAIEEFALSELRIVANPGNPNARKDLDPNEIQEYYASYNKSVFGRASFRVGTKDIDALDVMPKDTTGEVNWTTAVSLGMIDPAPSIDRNVVDEAPFDLTIFIEAKTPLMANVLFPHSIHTYWLKCSNCHPGIFLPQAGANDISMNEIFEGKWCGRCHGKVAFTFFPRANCARCHIIPKGHSYSEEHWS